MEKLTVSELTKSYGDKHVLQGLSLSVAPGQIYGFVGANGAGKSTTMRIILGVLAADSGEVKIGNSPITQEMRRRIGYMPEERGLYAKEKITDQLIFLAKLHGLDSKQAADNAASLLAQLGLSERAHDKLETLSLGNQQRVQLAASLIHDPELLVLDEPFSGLDPLAVDVMSKLLKQRAEQGVQVIFSSHQLDLVQRLCDQVGIISAGRIAASGTVSELRNRGRVLFAVRTNARNWYPPGTRLVSETDKEVVLEAASVNQEQLILQAAQQAGPVHGFGRKLPHLSELFQEVVQA